MIAIKLSAVSALEQLRTDIATAKERALAGSEVEVFDHYRNRFKKEQKPDYSAYFRLLELEAKIAIALELAGDADNATVDVSAEELREILEGLEKNGASEPSTKQQR